MKVPAFRQRSELTCGPTALRMVLNYFHRKIPEKKIIEGAGGIRKYGVRTIKLAEFARKSGFETEVLSYNKKLSKGRAKIKKPSVRDISKHLGKNRPVIIAVRSFLLYNKKPSGMGHFLVITKYKNGFFWYNDPLDGKQHKIKKENLLPAWRRNAMDSSAYLLAIWPQ